MRMWMTDPSLLCRNHLLGEHNEIHKLEGHLRRGRALGKYLSDGLVDPTLMRERHDALADEMARRGYNHRSPLPEVSYDGPPGTVDARANVDELTRRCPACAERMRRAA